MKHQRRQRHNDHRSAIIQQRCSGHTDGLVSGIQEHPAGAHGRAGQQDQRYIHAASGKGKTVTGQEEKGQQTYAAQQRPQQHDLPAVKGNVAGNNTIEAEQQYDEVTDKKRCF